MKKLISAFACVLRIFDRPDPQGTKDYQFIRQSAIVGALCGMVATIPLEKIKDPEKRKKVIRLKTITARYQKDLSRGANFDTVLLAQFNEIQKLGLHLLEDERSDWVGVYADILGR